jgi:gamma-glutamylcysteine synthetase
LNPSTQIETRIQHIETQLDELRSALLADDPASLEAASAALRTLAVDLSNTIQSHISAEHMTARSQDMLRQRIQDIASQIALNRDGLARRSANVERALHTLVPSTQIATYAGAGGRYGTNSARTGAFKTLAA